MLSFRHGWHRGDSGVTYVSPNNCGGWNGLHSQYLVEGQFSAAEVVEMPSSYYETGGGKRSSRGREGQGIEGRPGVYAALRRIS